MRNWSSLRLLKATVVNIKKKNLLVDKMKYINIKKEVLFFAEKLTLTKCCLILYLFFFFYLFYAVLVYIFLLFVDKLIKLVHIRVCFFGFYPNFIYYMVTFLFVNTNFKKLFNKLYLCNYIYIYIYIFFFFFFFF